MWGLPNEITSKLMRNNQKFLNSFGVRFEISTENEFQAHDI